jgi:LmbE family N-acetylglucosaminyl deacetylase
MRLSAIIAHPDYAPLYFGGTIIRHARRGDEVTIAALSAGEIGAAFSHPGRSVDELIEIKTRELEAVGKMQGVKEVRVLGAPDTRVANTPELRMTIVDLIREWKPDIVITNWPLDGHPDVREVAQAVIDACFFAYLPAIETRHPSHMIKKLYAFAETAGSENFEPDFCVDISDLMDEKIHAAAQMESTIGEITKLFTAEGGNPEQWPDIFRNSNSHWGQQSGVKYAEPFKELNVHSLGKRALKALPV